LVTLSEESWRRCTFRCAGQATWVLLLLCTISQSVLIKILFEIFEDLAWFILTEIICIYGA
jgi:hypothetical protein